MIFLNFFHCRGNCRDASNGAERERQEKTKIKTIQFSCGNNLPPLAALASLFNEARSECGWPPSAKIPRPQGVDASRPCPKTAIARMEREPRIGREARSAIAPGAGLRTALSGKSPGYSRWRFIAQKRRPQIAWASISRWQTAGSVPGAWRIVNRDLQEASKLFQNSSIGPDSEAHDPASNGQANTRECRSRRKC